MRCSIFKQELFGAGYESVIFNTASLLVLQVLYWEEIWAIQTEPVRVQSVSNPAAILWKGFYGRDHAKFSVWQQAVTCAGQALLHTLHRKTPVDW